MNIQNGMGTTMGVSTVNDWGDDVIPVDTGQPEPMYLTPQQQALRDNIAPPPVNQGMARAKRLEQMQRDMNALVDFANDLDRYMEHAKDAPLVGNEVGPYVAQYLKTLRAEVSAKGRQMYDDLVYLRAHQ